jgi:hypothetical protein
MQSKFSGIDCPDCGSPLLKFRESFRGKKVYMDFKNYHYCINCDTLFRRDSSGEFWATTKTNQPYLDAQTLLNAYRSDTEHNPFIEDRNYGFRPILETLGAKEEDLD